MTVLEISFSLRNLPVQACDSRAQGFSPPLTRQRSSCPPPSPNLVRTHPIEYYQALRDSAPCLSRAATLPKGTKLGLGKRRASGNTIIFSQPYRRRVSTDRLNREGSQLAASLEVEPGPTPTGKTLPHLFPETRFRRERARGFLYNDMYHSFDITSLHSTNRQQYDIVSPTCSIKTPSRCTIILLVYYRLNEEVMSSRVEHLNK